MNGVDQYSRAHGNYEQIVRDEWTAPTTAEAWRRWSDKTAIYMQGLTRAILDAARLAPGLKVLDLASGDGDPALSIANSILPNGRVTATDLSADLLKVAEDNAKRKKIGNIEFRHTDAHQLPFDNSSFDRVTCRLGVMYFWDCQQVIKETLRVLRPGGTAAFVAWGPSELSSFRAMILDPFLKRKAMSPPPTDAPHPTLFAEQGSLSRLFKGAGFQQVVEETQIVEMNWPGPPEEAFQHFYEAGVPLRAYIDSFSEQDRKIIIREIVEAHKDNWDGQFTRAEGAINIVSGVK